MTQFTVEVVTIILLLLALNFLPNRTPVRKHGRCAAPATRPSPWRAASRRWRCPITTCCAIRWRRRSREFHLANSYKGGGGTNVVNVILVDFRGFDTFGEIIVLGIAALLIYALTEALLAGPVRARLLNRKPDQPRAGDMHPLMMVVLTRVIMPVVLMVGFYIFLRGHNEPGGGFIAGPDRVDRRGDAVHGQRLRLDLGAAALSLSRGHRRGRADRGADRDRRRGSSASRS